MQTLKYKYWFHQPRKTLPQNSAEKSTAKNAGSKTPAIAKCIRHLSCTSQGITSTPMYNIASVLWDTISYIEERPNFKLGFPQ